MIVELSVENLAIIERCDLTLGPGFTALTGETGAGKSLVVDALELAFGARADASLVRSGAARALVSVTVDLSGLPELAAQCRELGAEPEDGVLFLQREVFAEGRSQCRIGGRLAPVSTLREIGRRLVDLHGQHEHQSLLDPKTHLAYLDAWIGGDASNLRNTVSQKLAAWQELDRRLSALRGSRRERDQRIDLLRFQVGDIEAVAPVPNELAELETRLSRLKNAEALAQTAAAVRQALIDGEPAAADLIGAASHQLADSQRLDPTLRRIADPLGQAAILLEEAISELRQYEDGTESSPEALEETAGRIDVVKRLLRKYGDDETAVLAFLQAAKEELELLTADEEGEGELETAEQDARKALDEACEALRKLRTEKAAPFAREVEAQLRELAMEKARFDVSFATKPPEEDGADAVEFVFSANVGEALKPLSRIASGGEISRAMLAIKTTLSGRAGVPTLIFDEVDVGLGGRAAATVAKKLETLSQFSQVLAITHLPQIAGAASAHFRVEKYESNGRVVAEAKPIHGKERIEELARMIAGEEVGESAREHAKALLAGSGTA